ncbi:unnamed protein product [Closterium sp. NIES-65]|nr:unnamed protein product [Closterium sp. NIES-65]
MEKHPHNEDDDGILSRVSDGVVPCSGYEILDGEKGLGSGDMRDSKTNIRRAATDLPRAKAPYTRRSAYLTARQREALASRFYNELKQNTVVGDDYKVHIQSDKFSRELQEDFLHMFAQPQYQAGHEGEVIAPRAAESVGKLNICMLIVGTRGDVPPFIAIVPFPPCHPRSVPPVPSPPAIRAQSPQFLPPVPSALSPPNAFPPCHPRSVPPVPSPHAIHAQSPQCLPPMPSTLSPPSAFPPCHQRSVPPVPVG